MESNVKEAAPLKGVRVVEFGQFIAGPGATQTLAELGADVIKIESQNGDNARRFGASEATRGRSGMFLAYNKGKRSIVLDLRKDEGVVIARRIALEADVVVQNTRVGVMEAMGLDATSLRREKPGLIYVSISGFGATGPSRSRPGLDIAAQAESGMMSLTGEPGGTPLKTGFPVVDVATASSAANAILAALFKQQRTGEGATIETSLLASALSLQAQIWAEYQCSGRLPQRSGNSQPLVAPGADLVRVKDGYVVVSAYLEEHWRRLGVALGKPELSSDPRFISNADRVKNRKALLAELEDSLGGLDGESVKDLMAQHNVVVGVVRDYSQILNNADIAATGVLQAVKDEYGTDCLLPGLPFKYRDESQSDRRGPTSIAAIPKLGEHTAMVLAEYGYSAAAIESFRQNRIIN